MRNDQKPSAVLDTNVLVSGIVFGGKPRRLLDLLAEDELTVVLSEELLSEARRVVTTKFPQFKDDLETITQLLQRDGVIVKLGKVDVRVCRDPDDDKVIEAALIGNCRFIVSGDKDLLAIGRYKSIEIIKPADFLKKL